MPSRQESLIGASILAALSLSACAPDRHAQQSSSATALPNLSIATAKPMLPHHYPPGVVHRGAYGEYYVTDDRGETYQGQTATDAVHAMNRFVGEPDPSPSPTVYQGSHGGYYVNGVLGTTFYGNSPEAAIAARQRAIDNLRRVNEENQENEASRHEGSTQNGESAPTEDEAHALDESQGEVGEGESEHGGFGESGAGGEAGG